MTQLTKNDNGTWYGYLWRWGDPIPERPGQIFKQSDRPILNVSELQGAAIVGANGKIWNIQKTAAEGLLVVIISPDDLTNYKLGYNLTSDNDIQDEKPYDSISGEVGYRLRKYPIKDIVVMPVEAQHASTTTGPIEASFSRPKRGRKSDAAQ